jgi:hypothetical protein
VKKLAIAVVALALLALVLAPAMAKDMPDVPFTHWAYDAVDELTDIGILQGYPDGNYGGQRTLTRYEFAEATVKLVHYLENYVDEKTAALEAGATAAEARAIAKDEAAKAVAAIKIPTFNMTLDQVKAAAAAAGAQAAKDALAGMSPGVTKAEVQTMIDLAVKNLVTKDYVANLAAEFRADIQELGVDVDDLMYRVDQLEAKLAALDARVTAIENKPDKVTGEIKWRVGTANDGEDWERFSNLEVKVHIDGKISDKAQGHITIWRPDATYDWDERGTHIDTAYVDVQDGLFKGLDWRLGQQYYKTGLGLTFDNNVNPAEAVKLNFDLLGANATVFWGTNNYDNSWWGYEPEMVTLLYNLKKQFGNLTLDGTFVDRNLWNDEQRWGVAAMYEGLDVPFFGLKANLEGEYTEYAPPWTSYNSYYTGATLMKKHAQDGDFKLKLTFADNGNDDNEYWPYQNGFVNYDGFVWYNNLTWDFLLSEAPNLGVPEGKTWSATLTKEIGSVDALLRWRRYVPYYDDYSYLDSWGYSSLYEAGNLWQLSLTKALAKGVDAKLTYAQLEDSWYDDTYKYVGGSINVVF